MSKEIPLNLDIDNLFISNSKQIDIMMFGASRPEIFEKTIISFKNHVKFSGTLYFYIDDGDFDHDNALKVQEIAKQHNFDGIVINKTGSYGYAITNSFNKYLKSKYVFFLEDDWECIQDIDLDFFWDCLEQNQQINQIRFNRHENHDTNYYRDFNKEYFNKHLDMLPYRITINVNQNEYPFIGSLHWYFNPAIWRTNFIIQHWKGFYRNIHHAFNNHLIYKITQSYNRPSPSAYVHQLGLVTYGDVDHPPFFKDIGREFSIHTKQGFV